MGGGNIEKDQFIGAFPVLKSGQFHRVARIPELQKLRSFDHPAILNVQARNDPFGKHR